MSNVLIKSMAILYLAISNLLYKFIIYYPLLWVYYKFKHHKNPKIIFYSMVDVITRKRYIILSNRILNIILFSRLYV